MKRNPNIPKFKEKLYIVCEGIGDKIYLDKILSLYESKYDIKVIPSGGKNKIIDKLREVLIFHPHNKSYIFIDTDTEGVKALENYKKQMKQNEISCINNIYFVNPIIEYLYLITQVNMHPTDFYTKDKFRKLFEKYFGIIEYAGTQKQYEQMVDKISLEAFEKNINRINKNINFTPSSTIIDLVAKITNKTNE